MFQRDQVVVGAKAQADHSAGVRRIQITAERPMARFYSITSRDRPALCGGGGGGGSDAPVFDARDVELLQRGMAAGSAPLFLSARRTAF